MNFRRALGPLAKSYLGSEIACALYQIILFSWLEAKPIELGVGHQYLITLWDTHDFHS